MILIISTPFDHATAQVISWLNCFNASWFRINQFLVDDKSNAIDFTINLSVDSATRVCCTKPSRALNHDLLQTKVVWFRRVHASPPIRAKGNQEWIHELNERLTKTKSEEKTALIESLQNSLRDKFWLSSPDTANTNKFKQLVLAQQVGMKIPDTLLTTRKDELLEFNKKNGKTITKALQNIPHIRVDKYHHSLMMYTNIITKDDIDSLPDRFYPSIFQKYLDKSFEIRTFYLNGNFFSCAMFTQSNYKTQIDFRRYDFERPSRRVPFKLPVDVESKLSNLMTLLSLNTGSIDIIYHDNEYFFLEVNPVGQFGFVSYPCNYLIEKHVATFLKTKCQQ